MMCFPKLLLSFKTNLLFISLELEKFFTGGRKPPLGIRFRWAGTQPTNLQRLILRVG